MAQVQVCMWSGDERAQMQMLIHARWQLLPELLLVQHNYRCCACLPYSFMGVPPELVLAAAQ